MLCIFAKEESLNILIGKYDYDTDIAVQREETSDMGLSEDKSRGSRSLPCFVLAELL